MTPRTKGGILDGLAITGIAYAANSVGRLNVPDSLAGPYEYGIYAALPFAAAVLCAIVGTAYKPSPNSLGAPTTTDHCLQSLGAEAAALVAEGKTNEARALLDAADIVSGVKK